MKILAGDQVLRYRVHYSVQKIYLLYITVRKKNLKIPKKFLKFHKTQKENVVSQIYFMA